MRMTRFLKLVLTADALSCLSMGTALVAATAPLAELFGLAGGLVFGAGLTLLPVGLYILAVALRENVAPVFVFIIIAGNVLWVAESLVVAASTPLITTIGTAFVLIQAAAVVVLTTLEAKGLVRIRRTLTARS